MFGPFGAGGAEALFDGGRSGAFERLSSSLEALAAAGRCRWPIADAALAAWSAVHGLATLLVDGPIAMNEAVMADAFESAARARLQGALDARATETSRAFWQRYLTGAARFRGVAMAGVREVVHAWWTEEAFGERSIPAQTRVALRLFEEEPSEDKLAGVLALSEILMPHLSKRKLPALARLFARGHIADWNLCDWFCVKVLGKMVENDPAPLELAGAISAWRTSKPLWQRRAACVAFVYHARHGDARIPGLSRLILENADALVRDPERFARTGVGWVLRELSLADRKAVLAFAEEHAGRLSREGMKYSVEKLPAAERKRLLALQVKRVAAGAGQRGRRRR